jgi:hypothetical protein
MDERRARFIAYRNDVQIRCYLKCGYSSVAAMKEQGRLDDMPSGPVRMSVGLVRHPYRRVESFYKDKLVEAYRQGADSQDCHVALRPFFDEDDLVAGRVSLRSFVLDGLDCGYDDSHLVPLAEVYPDLDRVVDLDRRGEMADLEALLGVRFAHENRTYERRFVWTLGMRRVVGGLFTADFRRFGYRI